MRLSYIGVLLVFLLSLSLGCSSGTETSGSNHLIDFFPTRTWVYKLDYTDRYTLEKATAYDTVTVSLTKTDINGELWENVIHANKYAAIPDFFPMMINRDDGVWVTFDAQDTQYRLFKYPVEVGEEYSISPTRVITADRFIYFPKMTGLSTERYKGTDYLCYNYEYIVSGGHEAQIRRITIAPGFTILKGRYITSQGSRGWDTATYSLQ